MWFIHSLYAQLLKTYHCQINPKQRIKAWQNYASCKILLFSIIVYNELALLAHHFKPVFANFFTYPFRFSCCFPIPSSTILGWLSKATVVSSFSNFPFRFSCYFSLTSVLSCWVYPGKPFGCWKFCSWQVQMRIEFQNCCTIV